MRHNVSDNFLRDRKGAPLKTQVMYIFHFKNGIINLNDPYPQQLQVACPGSECSLMRAANKLRIFQLFLGRRLLARLSLIVHPLDCVGSQAHNRCAWRGGQTFPNVFQITQELRVTLSMPLYEG